MNNHHITSVKWEVEIKEETKATSIYEQFNQLFKEQMIEIIEEVLSQHSTPDYHIRMDELMVDLGNFDGDFVEEEIIERFTKALERALTAKLFAHPQYRDQPLFEKQSKIESDLAVFQYFLKYGNLPSYRNQTNLSLEEIVKEQLIVQPNAVVFALKKANGVGVTRFIEQFSTQTTESLIRVLSSHYYLTILQQLKIFERLYGKLLPANLSLKNLLYKGALSYLIENQGGVFDLKDFQKIITRSIQNALPISTNEISNEEKIILIQHYLIHGWLPNRSKENIKALIQTVLKQSPTKLESIFKAIQAYPQAVERMEKEVKIQMSDTFEVSDISYQKPDLSKDLTRFFETGIVPIWASTDILIFENWLIKALEKQATILEKYKPMIVVNRIVGVFTIESVFKILNIIAPKLATEIQVFLNQQTQKSVWQDKTELVLFVLEKTLLKVLISKDQPITIESFIKKIEKEIGVPPTKVTVEKILKPFFQTGTLPEWTDGKPMVFEQWFLTTFKYQQSEVLQQLKAEKAELVVAKLVKTLSLDGLFTTLFMLHLPSYQLINSYVSTLSLSKVVKIALIEKALMETLKNKLIEINEIEIALLKILAKEGKRTKETQQQNQPKKTRQSSSSIEKRNRKDTIAYILQEGKLPFWLEKSKNVDEVLLALIEEEPDVLRVIFRNVNTNQQLEKTIVQQFSEVAISQLLNTLLPNFFGFINTMALAIERLVEHPKFPTKNEKERQTLKWEGILKYVFTTLNQTFNINQFVCFVLEVVAKKENQSKEQVFNWTMTVIEKAIEKGEKRFSPFRNILFSQRRNFIQSTVQLQKTTYQPPKTYNPAFLKLLSIKGIATTTATKTNEIPAQYQPLVRLVTLEYFFLYGAFPIESLQKETTIDELVKTILKESPTPLSHIFRKNSKKDQLLKILIRELAPTTFQQIIRLFYPTQAENLKTYHNILQTVFGQQKIGSQTIEREVLVVHQLKYVLSINESKYTQQHYTQQFLKTITRVYRIEYKTVLMVLENRMDAIPATYQKALQQTVVALRKLLPKRYKPVQVVPNQESYRTWREPKADEILYVKNAGLVLVYPLLAFYFKSLEMTTPLKKFKNPATANRAVHLLQYIATKEENVPEFELSLNKILCDVPFGKPIESGIKITENEKKWSEELLKVVIKQWIAIKNTTPDGLRNSFLKREGRLSKKDANWVLRVEKKPYDMLLGKLPWGLSMVKLPWMKEALYVEWG